MADSWQKACGEGTVSWSNSLSISRPSCISLYLIFYQVGEGIRIKTYYNYFKKKNSQKAELIRWDNNPVRMGYPPLVTRGVYSALFQSWRGDTVTLRHFSPPSPVPNFYLSLPPPQLLVSKVRALLLSPNLFLHPEPLFGDGRCVAFGPNGRFLFPGVTGDTCYQKKKKILINKLWHIERKKCSKMPICLKINDTFIT